MNSETVVHRGTVHGRTIELESDTGFPEGQIVQVTLQPATDRERLPPGEGFRRSAGSWADDPEGLDEYLAWNRQQRKASRRSIES